MVEISNDLISFKKEVGDNIDSMKSCASNISNKLNKLENTVTNTSSLISDAYNSSNKNTLLDKFNNIKEIVQKIENSIYENLEVKFTNSSSIIDKIAKLETKKSQVDAKYNEAQQDSSKSYEYYNLLSEFNELHGDAIAALNELKAQDTEISFENEFQTNDLSVISENLKFGSYEKHSFTSSINYKINYYLYTPDYGEKVDGLPTLVYLCGAGERGDRTNTSGLPSLIDQRKITPSGIVIAPQYSGEQELNTSEYQKSIMELIDNVVTQNNGDKNKISLCGHSVGATVGYSLVADNPNYFAAFVPISGKAVRITDKKGNILSNAYEALKNTKILSICGTGDTAYGNYQTSEKLIDDLKSANPNAHFIPIKGFGHIIQTKVFNESYKLENGEDVSILDWAFNQSKT